MRSLCIIPARGGSKRIPRKNIKDFLGKPVIAYSIAAALESGLFDEVMVSTNDEEIAKVSRQHSAKVPFLRSAAASNDTASTLDALREVLQQYEAQDRVPEVACCIYPAAPFVTATLLREAHALLLEQAFDCVFPVIRYGAPVQRSISMDDRGAIRVRHPEYVNSRSQDLEAVYHDSGMFYFFRPEAVLSAGKLWTDNTGGIPVSALTAHDIDSEADWTLAELKYQRTQV